MATRRGVSQGSEFDLTDDMTSEYAEPEVVESVTSEETEAMFIKVFEESKWQAIGKWCLYALVFLTPWFLLPFTYAPVDINKHMLATLLITGALVSFFISVIEYRRVRYPKSPLALAVLVLLAVFGLSTIFSKAPIMSLYGNFLRTDSFFDILLFSIAFFMAFYFLKEADIPKLGVMFLAGVDILNLYGITQSFGRFLLPWGFTQSTGFTPSGSLVAWGILVSSVVVIGAAIPFEELQRKWRIFVFASIILSAISLVLLNYQYLWITTAVVLIAIAGIRFVSHASFRLPVAMALVAIFFALVSSYMTPIVNLPAEIRPDVGSTFSVARQTIFGWRAFLGSGPSMFPEDYALYRPLGLNQLNLWNIRFNQGYNFLLTLLSTIGFLGVVAILFLMITFLRNILREHKKPYVTLVEIAIMFWLLHWFFYPAFFTQLLFVFLGLGMLVAIFSPKGDLPFMGLSPRMVFVVFILFMVLIGVTLSGFYRIGQKYVAAAEYGSALPTLTSGDVGASLNSLQSITTLDAQTDEYWRAASQVLLNQARQILASLNGSPNDQFQLAVANAIAAAQKATDLNPANAVNWNNLGSVYENLIPVAARADEFAVSSYSKAAELDPQNPDIPTNSARVLLLQYQRLKNSDANAAQGKLNDLQSTLDRAVSLKPDYAPPRFLYAQVYLREGDFDKVANVFGALESLRPTDAVLEYQIGLFYYQNNQLDSAQSKLERAVALSPSYADARYILGQVYSKEGFKDRALEQFERVLATNPSNADVQRQIDSLQRFQAPSNATSSQPKNKVFNK